MALPVNGFSFLASRNQTDITTLNNLSVAPSDPIIPPVRPRTLSFPRDLMATSWCSVSRGFPRLLVSSQFSPVFVIDHQQPVTGDLTTVLGRSAYIIFTPPSGAASRCLSSAMPYRTAFRTFRICTIAVALPMRKLNPTDTPCPAKIRSVHRKIPLRSRSRKSYHSAHRAVSVGRMNELAGRRTLFRMTLTLTAACPPNSTLCHHVVDLQDDPLFGERFGCYDLASW